MYIGQRNIHAILQSHFIARSASLRTFIVVLTFVFYNGAYYVPFVFRVVLVRILVNAIIIGYLSLISMCSLVCMQTVMFC